MSRLKKLSARAKRVRDVERLIAAMDRCALARGEAQWTNGYRAAKGPPDEANLYRKEMAQWKHAALTERAFRTLAKRVLLDTFRAGSLAGGTER